MTQLEKDDKKAHKELNNFKKAYHKLLAKHPYISVYGDRDGKPTASTYSGNGPYGKMITIHI
jgi:hypothetical protein